MTRRIWHCIKSHLRPYSTHPFIIDWLVWHYCLLFGKGTFFSLPLRLQQALRNTLSLMHFCRGSVLHWLLDNFDICQVCLANCVNYVWTRMIIFLNPWIVTELRLHPGSGKVFLWNIIYSTQQKFFLRTWWYSCCKMNFFQNHVRGNWVSKQMTVSLALCVSEGFIAQIWRSLWMHLMLVIKCKTLQPLT